MSDEPRDHSQPREPGSGPGNPPTRSTPVRRTHSAEHGLLIAGRIAVALVAVLVLTATGWEWAIKSRADSGIVSRQISAIVTDDSNLSTATVAPPRGRLLRAGEHPAARLGHPRPGPTATPATPTPAPATGLPTRTPR